MGPNDERDRLDRKLCQRLIEAPRPFPLILSLSKDESNYERAQRRLDLPDLILVCRAMGVEPVEILKRLGGRPSVSFTPLQPS